MSEEVIVRRAERRDMVEVMAMIQELADFEKMPDGPKINAACLENDCFDNSPPLFQCFVAESRTETGSLLIGYTIFFNTYSTWEGKALMLEDIYVKPEFRKKGVGLKILSTIAKLALDTGCCRVDFHVLEWNPARTFYEANGAVNLTGAEDWLFYRLSKDALMKFKQ